ncbi:MAG: HAMP domain-containing histidine kinase [Lachnospiraceae bacterium]|nr:HAMP domain-containing histidine kinase [Lachnospiraceae bacterium]
MKRRMKWGLSLFLGISEHLLAVAAVICLLLVNAGQTVILTGPAGERSYRLYESDRNRSYEDSVLFNNIFGNNLAAVAEYVAICSLFESAGDYAPEKTIDVTAWVNRKTMLAEDYITARYQVANLLKWAQNGFEYENREMTSKEQNRFFADQTTWTHLINNPSSGGMNSYLNSQIEGNAVTVTGDQSERQTYEGHAFYDSFYDEETPETCSILINRYRTEDGCNIENIVTNWEDYQALCSNVVETGKSLLKNYEQYRKWKEYFDEGNSSMRYYIVRMIGGKQEIYTNVTALKGKAMPDKIDRYFEGLSRYLYYCPYDMSYETNCLIDEESVRTMFNKTHSVDYPDQIRVWAGAELPAEGIRDDFHAGMEESSRYLPSAQTVQLMGILFAFLWAVILLVRVLLAGTVPSAGKTDAGEPFLYPFDRWPTELLAVLFGACGLLLFIGPAAQLLNRLSWNRYAAGGFRAAAGSILISGWLLCFVRKYKAKRLLSDSLIVRAARGIKRMVQFTMGHANLAVSTFVPCLLFIAVNLPLTAVLFGLRSVYRYPVMLLTGLADLIVVFILYRNRMCRREIIEGIERIGAGETAYQLPVDDMRGENRRLALAVNAIGEGIEDAVNTSMQDERLKTELITNVSHDIKTPLTSIINYVGLLKREPMESEKARSYVNILEEKSEQLKRLTEDLVEASKISSGNIEINYQRLNFVEFIHQTVGEFDEKFAEKNLVPVIRTPERPVFIVADSHHLWRVMENLLGNVAKYSLEHTRVYLELAVAEVPDSGREEATLTIRNISANELHVNPRELTERFIRGDEARSSEGSGLGLSIAEQLTRAQGGELTIDIDNDLFRVAIRIPVDENGEG